MEVGPPEETTHPKADPGQVSPLIPPGLEVSLEEEGPGRDSRTNQASPVGLDSPPNPPNQASPVGLHSPTNPVSRPGPLPVPNHLHLEVGPILLPDL